MRLLILISLAIKLKYNKISSIPVLLYLCYESLGTETMSTPIIIITILCCLAVYTGIFITYHVVKSDFFDKKQKVILISVAWLLPIIGAGLIFSLLAEDKPIKKRSSFHLLDYIFLTAVLTQNSNSFDSGSPANYDQSSSCDSDI